MIDFKPISLQDKKIYENYLFKEDEHCCNYSFANLFMWGEQSTAILQEHFLIFTHFKKMQVYPYPLGNGDKKTVIDAIIADAKERGIPCKITVMGEAQKAELEQLYPGKFTFYGDRDSSDYVYAIDDLADLKGRKYHRKKNHYNGFKKSYPDATVEPLTKHLLPQVKEMTDNWFLNKLTQNPDGDYEMEKIALSRALTHYEELEMEGLVLLDGNEILAVTLGSRMSENTFDVHFEKARPDAQGAYAAINCEFARYIRTKYPQIQFLNREEDLGIEGLRKAKESYLPHHMVEKYQAWLNEN
ncbi:MAG: DUF2156 domain-containing protein [Lachnospiraceae bacterium]|nr:DUF2156 domain-containing protein [Lachnospiraceae bacterium]